MAIWLIWIVIVILAITIVYYNTNAMKRWTATRKNIVIDTIYNSLNGVPIDTTKNICCYNDGLPTGAYYVKVNGIGYSVISEPTSYLEVCRELCILGSEIVNGKIVCKNNSGKESVEKCVSSLVPKYTISLARPIANLGPNSYYALHAETLFGLEKCTVSSC